MSTTPIRRMFSNRPGSSIFDIAHIIVHEATHQIQDEILGHKIEGEPMEDFEMEFQAYSVQRAFLRRAGIWPTTPGLSSYTRHYLDPADDIALRAPHRRRVPAPRRAGTHVHAAPAPELGRARRPRATARRAALPTRHQPRHRHRCGRRGRHRPHDRAADPGDAGTPPAHRPPGGAKPPTPAGRHPPDRAFGPPQHRAPRRLAARRRPGTGTPAERPGAPEAGDPDRADDPPARQGRRTPPAPAAPAPRRGRGRSSTAR